MQNNFIYVREGGRAGGRLPGWPTLWFREPIRLGVPPPTNGSRTRVQTTPNFWPRTHEQAGRHGPTNLGSSPPPPPTSRELSKYGKYIAQYVHLYTYKNHKFYYFIFHLKTFPYVPPKDLHCLFTSPTSFSKYQQNPWAIYNLFQRNPETYV